MQNSVHYKYTLYHIIEIISVKTEKIEKHFLSIWHLKNNLNDFDGNIKKYNKK